MFTNSCQFVRIFQRRLLLNFEFLALVKILKKGTIFSSRFLTKVPNRAARSHLTKPLITLLFVIFTELVQTNPIELL